MHVSVMETPSFTNAAPPEQAEPLYEAFCTALAAEGPPEVAMHLEDGDNGVLVEPENPQALADGIIGVLSQPGMRNRLVTGGAATLSRYSEDAIMRDILGLYCELKIEDLRLKIGEKR